MADSNFESDTSKMSDAERRKRIKELKARDKELDERTRTKDSPGCLAAILISLFGTLAFLLPFQILPVLVPEFEYKVSVRLLVTFVIVPVFNLVVLLIALREKPEDKERYDIKDKIREYEEPDRQKAIARLETQKEKVIENHYKFASDGGVYELLFTDVKGSGGDYFRNHGSKKLLCKRDGDTLHFTFSKNGWIEEIEEKLCKLRENPQKSSHMDYSYYISSASSFPESASLSVDSIECFCREGERTEYSEEYVTGGNLTGGGTVINISEGVSTYLPHREPVKKHIKHIVIDTRRTVIKFRSGEIEELSCDYKEDPYCFDKLNALIPEKNDDTLSAERESEKARIDDEEYQRNLKAYEDSQKN